jgi:sulfur-oxidizing protein SoxA
VRTAFVFFGCLFLVATAEAEIPLAERKSGYEFMGRETRAMQDDDKTGPAVLALLEGEELWSRRAGESAKSCADCHRLEKMRGVAVRYPAFNTFLKKPINLDQRINLCRTEQQKAPSLAYESRPLLALSALVGRQSRGLPIEVVVDEKTKPRLEAGRKAFFQRQGQLNLSCAQCHDQQWGKSLAGTPIPQGHATGYPIYRLEWQDMGSLQRRLRNCMIGVRAEPYAYGAQEYVELELYLMHRARGMKLETPAVRP